MISIQNLSFYFGSRALYNHVNLHIKPKDKMALVGANGTGKSTFLKIIAGDLSPDEGEINKAKDCSIGFLNQDLLSFKSSESILNVVMTAFERENQLAEEIEKALLKLDSNFSHELVEKLGKMQEEFDSLEGYTIKNRAEEILEGLGFATSDLQEPLENFSGGWRMRVMLGKMLLMKPALLLLDEPTNHLDLPSIEWLEKYISSYEGAVIVVSHDQTFLNNTTTKTAEVSPQGITLYEGNYDFYLKEKEERKELQQNAFINQQKKIKEQEAFIERFKAKATKAKQAQSKLKALEKMERVEEVVEDSQQINFHFNFNKPSGKIVLELKEIDKSYDEKVIFKNMNAHILRGDKIALIGANGKGKSTLLRIIQGQENFDGERTEGHNVISTMYAQHQLEDLGIENNMLEELQSMGIEKTELELRTILGAFLFGTDDVDKKIKVLSGGERSRVALAKTLISDANFLLLDEPTNHLDIKSVSMLTKALNEYNGSYVVISHDRKFIKNIANKIWYIEDYQLKEYPGTYDEFDYWMKQKAAKAGTTLASNSPTAASEVKSEIKTEVRTGKPASHDQEKYKQQQKEIKRLTNKIAKLETLIEENETLKTELEEKLSLPEVFSNPDKLAEYSTQLQEVNTILESANCDWATHVEELEQLENEA